MKPGQSVPAFSFKNPAVRARLRKLAMWAGALLVFCYLGGVTAGYLWLRHGRGVEQVRVLDVAFLRVDAVRETLGLQHFARARTEAAEKKYQAAYISYASGLRQAPDDIPGRLDAAAFFRSVGAANQSLAVLEEGLGRHPEDAGLIEATFGQLLVSGRARYALELLNKHYGAEPRGEQARALLTYRIRALLATEGPAAAAELLRKHPELKDYPPVAPVLARVLWDTRERLRAIALLVGHARGPHATLEDYVQLAGWQAESGLADESIRTAQAAVERFPDEPVAHAMVVEMKAATSPTGGPAQADVAAYLERFRNNPAAPAVLSATAARKGWLTLTRMLYELAALKQPDLGYLALNHADALARNSRYVEFRALLAQLEDQAMDAGNPAFLLQLRLRQIIAAGALKDSDNVREYSRRLAALVRNEPDRLEGFRQFFKRTGLGEAVEELTPAPAARPAANRSPAASGT